MKKDEIIKSLMDNRLLHKTYEKIGDVAERQRIKMIAEEVFVDIGNSFATLIEAMESPEVKEQLMIQLSTLLSGSSA